MPADGVVESDVLALSEGKDACSLFVTSSLEGARREVRIDGFDVCADLPEAKALLDGVLKHVCAKISVPREFSVLTLCPSQTLALRQWRHCGDRRALAARYGDIKEAVVYFQLLNGKDSN